MSNLWDIPICLFAFPIMFGLLGGAIQFFVMRYYIKLFKKHD